MMTWTKTHLETMNILQLRELKKHVDDVLKRKIKQSEELAERDYNEDSGERGSR